MAKKKAAGTGTDAILIALRDHGLALPGAHLKSPWPGHKDLAVDDKTFAYLSTEGEPLGVGCKLPRSSAVALLLPGATPMAYGLGKSGWVSMKLDTIPVAEIDVDMFKAWIDESYRAQASKRRLKELDAGTAHADAAKPTPAKPKRRARPMPRARARR